MPAASQLLSARFQLVLSESWEAWFNQFSAELKLPGLMREPVTSAQMCEETPSMIWPGFMLPDTLPLVGNAYGDWLCVRVTSEGTLGELIYWYHGGGDWIPVGSSLAEAILHDAVDQFRPIRTQMLRSAEESRVDTLANVLTRLDHGPLRRWLAEELPYDQPQAVAKIVEAVGSENYHRALGILDKTGWCEDAVACDLLDVALQEPVQAISNRDFSSAADVAWFPDYLKILFDSEIASEDQQQAILASARQLDEWPKQDWQLARQVASVVLGRRQDLGWSAAIAGWSYERAGAVEQAIACYQKGICASSFTDQGVRFNSHAETDEWGKFSAARLAANRDVFSSDSDVSDYTRIFLKDRKKSLLAEVSEYWTELAQNAERNGQFEEAYESYYRAGWDMGVSRMGEYAFILERLQYCASRAGWQSLAQVAELHLRCLEKRTR